MPRGSAIAIPFRQSHAGVWAALVAGALALALTACSGATPPAAAPPAASDGPAKPKVDRVVFATEPPALEGTELRHLSPANFMPFRPMYDALIGVDPTDSSNKPYLATEWALQPDGTSFKFKLREGVQLHHGAGTFGPQDVVAVAQEIVRDDSIHGNASFFRVTIKSVEPVGANEVIFHLTKPDGTFLSTMSEMSGGLEPFSKASLDKNGPATFQSGPHPGTGPYQFKEAQQGRFVRFERTPYKHYRVTPDFPEFEFRWVKEASTRMAALVAGEVHLANLPEDLLKQATAQGMKVAEGKVPALRIFAGAMCCFVKDKANPQAGYINPEDPLADVRVRKALSKAINRDELNKALFGGKAKPMYLNAFHPTRPGWDPGWERRFADEYGYDPAKARALLAEAGYTAAKPLQTQALLLNAAGYSGSQDIMEALAGYWRAVGIDVKLTPMDSNEENNIRRQMRHANSISLVGTASHIWTGNSAHGSSVGPRGARLELPDADVLLAQIAATLDEKKQDELWKKVGEVNFTQHKHIPLFWNPVEVLYDPKIVGDYIFGGYNSGAFTHVYNIKAAR